MISSINGLKKNKMNKLKEIKDLIADLKDCVDGNGVPNIHYISNRIADLEKVVNTINYIPCCMELNHDLKIGDKVVVTNRYVATISAFCADNDLIEIEDGCDYKQVDKEDVSKVV